MALVVGSDRVLAGEPFLYQEFSGWGQADATELYRLRELVRTILGPTRRAVGPLLISAGGWLYSRDGTRRDPDGHGTGGFVDFVPATTTSHVAYSWIRDNLAYGEVIDELDHVHVSLPGFGGNGEAWLVATGGGYVADPVRGEGVPLGLDYATTAAALPWAVAALLLVAIARAHA